MNMERLEVARHFHRFGFGPRPGEFKAALKSGVDKSRAQLLTSSKTPSTLVSLPVITDLGNRPAPNSPDVVEFSAALRYENQLLLSWWLDQMVAGENQLLEKMVWFWHGHWATSVGKVNYALPMFNQNLTFRKYALGNFAEFAPAMFSDGALQIWLDGGDNTVKAPNENLSREMMELFVLGVNRYTENDVKELARAFTGYRVKRSSGEITFVAGRRDTAAVNILGKSAVMSPEQAIAHLVSTPSCATFIAERAWHRLISSSEPLPSNHSMIKAFSGRDMQSLMESLISSADLANPQYSIVKSPVEWFIAICRAFNLTPSKLSTFTKLYNYLEKMSQIPLAPPNVGGWPANEAWLSSASAQFRLSFAQWLASSADLSELSAIAPVNRPQYLADLLGVVEWSSRTNNAMRGVRDNPQRLVALALCSPEYVVSQ